MAKIQQKLRIMVLASATLLLPLVSQAQWFIQGSGAYQFPFNQSSDVTVGHDSNTPPNPIINNYSSTSITNTWGYGAGIGYRYDLYPMNLGQYIARNEISLNVWQNTRLRINGNETQTDVQHINSTYQYFIDSNAALVEDKVFFRSGYQTVLPFILVGAGISQLNSHDYTTTAVVGSPSGPGYGNPYQDKQTTGLAWTAGLGISFDVTKNLSLLAYYRYLDLGKAETGQSTRAGGGLTDSGINYEMQMHSAVLGLTYYF